MVLKIYFAGSIRGGRDDREVYFELINYLSKYGVVLTEHVGSLLDEYDEEGMSDVEIFNRDVDWIRECDVLIADVSTPSLGVGYEIGFAESLGKRVLCLYRNQDDKKLSAMIEGNKDLSVFYYDSLDDVKMNIDVFFKEFDN